MVSPAEIIPLAEETGFIVPVGEWVLRQACAEAAKWPAHIKVAVNLSPKQFKSRNLVQTIVNAIVASGLSPGRLELEITETVLLSDSAATLETLRKLQNFGVQDRLGRLRHRLFLAELSAQLPLQQDQDRPILRQRPVRWEPRRPSPSCAR